MASSVRLYPSPYSRHPIRCPYLNESSIRDPDSLAWVRHRHARRNAPDDHPYHRRSLSTANGKSGPAASLVDHCPACNRSASVGNGSAVVIPRLSFSRHNIASRYSNRDRCRRVVVDRCEGHTTPSIRLVRTDTAHHRLSVVTDSLRRTGPEF